MNDLIYLDNAATSFPKHPDVARAMTDFLEHSAGNPGRGGHTLSRRAGDLVEEARHAIARSINAPCAARVVLTHGCTDALNLAIHGVIRAAVRHGAPTPIPVVTTALEHNAVLRTLHCYATDNLVALTIVQPDEHGYTHPESIASACTESTRLVCVTHASNAMGTIQPIDEIIRATRRAAPEALVLVDSAQTLGHIPIDVQRSDIDLLSIAGHKGLGGPTGTGALYLSQNAYADHCTQDEARVFCERRGGTGSIAPGLEMPTALPDALEAGTANAVGFAGLLAAMKHHDPSAHDHEMALTQRLLQGLSDIEHVTIYGPTTTENRTPVVLFNISGICARDVATILDKEHNIAVRGGVHCAPLTHESIGNGSDGGVRASPGRATTQSDIDTLLSAIERIAMSATQSRSA